jgi:hypothetical protein
MIAEFLATEAGIYTVAVLLAVAVGLTVAAAGLLIRLSAALTIVVFTALAFAWSDRAPWAGPLFALVAVLTGLLVSAHAQQAHPMLAAEPYWRRVLLIAAHGGRLRDPVAVEDAAPGKVDASP